MKNLRVLEEGEVTFITCRSLFTLVGEVGQAGVERGVIFL